MQEEIIAAILTRKDTFVLMPTGDGKSLCYQIPALVRPGGMVILCVFNLRQHHEHGFSSRYCARDEEYLDSLSGFEILQYEKMNSNGNYLDGYLFRRE